MGGGEGEGHPVGGRERVGAKFGDPSLALGVTLLRLYPVAAALCRPFCALRVPTLQMRKWRHRKFKLAKVGCEPGSVAVRGGGPRACSVCMWTGKAGGGGLGSSDHFESNTPHTPRAWCVHHRVAQMLGP